MSMKICPLQYLCPHYNNNTKQRGELSRAQKPCVDFLSGKCLISNEIQMFLSPGIACEIKRKEV